MAWNVVLGGFGSLILCLHDSGDIHSSSTQLAESCCDEDMDLDQHACENCTDLELEPVELISVRTQDSDLPAPDLILSHVAITGLQVLASRNTAHEFRSQRAPPGCLQNCLLISGTIVLQV